MHYLVIWYCVTFFFFWENRLHTSFLFLMWTIFKVFFQFCLQYCFCFMFSFLSFLFFFFFVFAHEAHGILASWPRIKPTPPCIGCKMSTTEPSWKPYYFVISILLFILLPVKTFIHRWKTRGPQYFVVVRPEMPDTAFLSVLVDQLWKIIYIQVGIHTDTDFLHF